MDSSQNQDGQCSQCLDHLGSRSSQNLISKCSHCTHLAKEPWLVHTEEGQESVIPPGIPVGITGEDQWISQSSQCYDSDSRRAGRLPIPTHGGARLSHMHHPGSTGSSPF
eukprot:2420795-Amphidinium_carterae.3